MFHPMPTAEAEAFEARNFPLIVLRILFFTGFAIVATATAFVFLPVAGVALALLVAWKGFDGLVWTHRDFALRALSMVAFTTFAVVATSTAFAFLAPAGVLLAAVFLWRGFGGFGIAPAERELAPQVAPGLAPTGNSAFDAYRADTLRRLEEERVSFEGFLGRLREARDRSEFDSFLDDRLRQARAGQAADDPAAGDS